MLLGNLYIRETNPFYLFKQVSKGKCYYPRSSVNLKYSRILGLSKVYIVQKKYLKKQH